MSKFMMDDGRERREGIYLYTNSKYEFERRSYSEKSVIKMT
jgi:hypothetical protein